jgi:hypothetical protein
LRALSSACLSFFCCSSNGTASPRAGDFVHI